MMTETMKKQAQPHPIDHAAARRWWLAATATTATALSAALMLIYSMTSAWHWIAALSLLGASLYGGRALRERAWDETPGAYGRRADSLPAHPARFLPTVVNWTAITTVVVWTGFATRTNAGLERELELGVITTVAYLATALACTAREKKIAALHAIGGLLVGGLAVHQLTFSQPWLGSATGGVLLGLTVTLFVRMGRR